ncbi:MAG: hypothetical protein PHD43_09685 [Methylococcales bacterium]|nr:hypothetical protein [Methylococcales bacterium]
MPKSIPFKKLAQCSLTTAALVAGSQGAIAHTRLEIPTVAEGVTAGHSQTGRVHNYLRIGHGCPPSDHRGATMGTSLVAPNAVDYAPVIGVDSGNGKEFTTSPASDFYSPLAGIVALNRTGGPWEFTNVKVDSKGNKDGFWAGGKAYDQTISTVVSVDLDISAITITPTSCARSVTFELAIADFCSISVPGATATDEEVLYWSPIPNFPGVPGQPFGASIADAARNIPVGPAYSNYDGYADAAHTIAGDGWGSPATVTVTRNLTANPLPAGCTGNGGAGDDVYVYPSAEQINKELPVWSKPDQTGTLYWQ